MEFFLLESFFLFLRNHDDKLVVSDIDGTITKSNVRGQILSMFGRDWYHENIVDLFHNIEQMGYRIIYLSARSICQSDTTRNLIRNLSQNSKKMPQGPLLLNPVNYTAAFQMELISKCSDQFKISCLKNIRELFEENLNPLHAGFGNNLTDVKSYQKVGISHSSVFIINQLGEVYKHDDSFTKLSYKKIVDEIYKYFPPSPSLSTPTNILPLSFDEAQR
jgi:phosphatidate phosphatase LPIN